MPDNNAFLFSGGSFVVIGGESAFDFAGPVTLEAWIKVRQFNRDWQTIAGKGDTSWQLHRLSNTRKVSFGTHTPTGGWHDLPTTADMDDGRWHHLVATYDGQTKRLYVDGLLDASTTVVSGALTRNDWRVAIGGCTEAAGRAFDGWIDEVAVYGRVLDAAEVAAHTAAGVGRVAGEISFALPGWGALRTGTLRGGWSADGSGAFEARGVGLPLAGGFSLANARVRFDRVAGATTGTLNVEGDLVAPSLAGLLEWTTPLRFAGSSTGGALSLSATAPEVSVGVGDPFLVRGGTLRLDAGGLRWTGAQLQAFAVVAGARRAYFTVALPDLILPAVVPAGGLAQNVNLNSLGLVAPGAAGGTALATHVLSGAGFTLNWRTNALELNGLKATYPELPGFPNWTKVAFENGRIDAAGNLQWTTAAALPSLDAGVFHLTAIKPQFRQTGLTLTGARLAVDGFFELPAALADLPLAADANGAFDWAPPQAPSLTLAGLPFPKVPLVLRRAAGKGGSAASLQGGGAELASVSWVTSLLLNEAESGIPGLPVFKFNGSIDSAGNIAMEHRAPVPTPFLGFSMTLTNRIDASPGRYRDAVLADAPQAYWRLGDRYTRVLPGGLGLAVYEVRDETGRHGATLGTLSVSGTLVTQGESGALGADADTSFRFNGAGNLGQFIALPVAQEASFDLATGFTTEFWVRLGTAVRGNEPLVTKGAGAWQIQRVDTSGRIGFVTTSGGRANMLTSTTDCADGRWHHVVATYNGQRKTLHIDGREEAAASEGPLGSNNETLRTGGVTDPSGTLVFQGWLDEVAIYPRALSAAQIQAHYQDAVPGSLTSRMTVYFANQPFAGFEGSISADGTVLARSQLPSKNLGGYAFGPVTLDLTRRPPAVPTLAVAATLTRPAAWSANLFSPWPTLRGFINPGTSVPTVTLGAAAVPLSVAGLPLDGLDFQLSGPLLPGAGAIPAINLSNARLTGYSLLPSSVLLSGSLPSSGALSLTRSLALNVGGFAAANGQVDLGPGGMTVRGSFDLKATVGGKSIDFARNGTDIPFVGTFGSNRRLVDDALLGTGVLQLGPFSTDTGEYKLQSTGLTPGLRGSHNLAYGALSVPFTTLNLSSAGMNAFSGSRSGTSSCGACLFRPEANYTVTLSRAANDGSISGSLGGQVVLKGPTAPGGPEQTRTVGLSGRVGSDGNASIALGFTLYAWEFVKNGCPGPFGVGTVDCFKWVGHSSVDLDLW
jgi:hypothetical protein